jgi:hypothetical protein
MNRVFMRVVSGFGRKGSFAENAAALLEFLPVDFAASEALLEDVERRAGRR